jgi:hypothetical protein
VLQSARKSPSRLLLRLELTIASVITAVSDSDIVGLRVVSSRDSQTYDHASINRIPDAKSMRETGMRALFDLVALCFVFLATAVNGVKLP